MQPTTQWEIGTTNRAVWSAPDRLSQNNRCHTRGAGGMNLHLLHCTPPTGLPNTDLYRVDSQKNKKVKRKSIQYLTPVYWGGMVSQQMR